MLYAGVLVVVGAAVLGVLPGLKATTSQLESRLRNAGSGRSTLRFGGIWTSAMVGQVALTVVCLPLAVEVSREVVRDRIVRGQFPAHEYLSVRIDLDEEMSGLNVPDDAAAPPTRRQQLYDEFAGQVAAEPGVVAVTLADRLPGMETRTRRAEMEAGPGEAPVVIPNLWTATVGPGFFEAFDRPIVSGRAFHDGDRSADSRTVIVNEAFARYYLGAGSPIGRRVRYRSAGSTTPLPWVEIIGVVRDIGMTPTGRGEAPYAYHPAAPAALQPAVMGIRFSGDPAALAPRVRAIAAGLDAALRLHDMRSLDRAAWLVDLPFLVVAGGTVGVVSLGLFLSAAGIFSLMSVSVARRTREIGVRTALGANAGRILLGILSRALVLVGSGVVIGNLVLVLLVVVGNLSTSRISRASAATSVIVLVVGLMACVEPARRALRIQPVDALRDT
jgi:hypothetical protein